MNAGGQGRDAREGMERATLRRVAWRILPFLMVCYFVAFVDRVNAGFAALHMNHDIGLSAAAFGLGGGLFYVTYVLFEIPSNLAMAKLGARLWIARIMISWGLVSGASAFVVGPWSFYFARMMLGAAEAGFFPGVILYLTYWFPRAYRGRVVAMFMVAIPISSFLGSPISAAPTAPGFPTTGSTGDWRAWRRNSRPATVKSCGCSGKAAPASGGSACGPIPARSSTPGGAARSRRARDGWLLSKGAC